MSKRRVIITGGAGFIGSNLIRYWLEKYPEDHIVNVDSMTYAARIEHVREYLMQNPNSIQRCNVEMMDIRSRYAVEHLVRTVKPDLVIHLAAESHVCRSIKGPEDFFTTNVIGTFNLLEECRRFWGDSKQVRFHHVSTDEVFGQLQDNEAPFDEQTPLAPRSPYAASKASSDLAVLCYRDTYSLPVSISNCSNNFGPNQHEEKLIPKIINTLFTGKPMTLYGSGKQIRDWLYVEDHCSAIDRIVHEGNQGHRYCVGGDQEFRNVDMVIKIHQILERVTGKTLPLSIEYTNDRPTDDYRYAVDSSKLKRDTAWEPKNDFNYALECTVHWYLDRMVSGQAGVRALAKQGSGAI